LIYLFPKNQQIYLAAVSRLSPICPAESIAPSLCLLSRGDPEIFSSSKTHKSMRPRTAQQKELYRPGMHQKLLNRIKSFILF
jgi:hypothetical protein